MPTIEPPRRPSVYLSKPGEDEEEPSDFRQITMLTLYALSIGWWVYKICEGVAKIDAFLDGLIRIGAR